MPLSREDGMMEVVSVEQMRNSDAYTIEHLVSGRELMYRAAYGVYLATKWEGRIAIVVGSGNNGGDGYALSCILAEKGINCVLIALSEPSTDDSRYYRRLAEEKAIEILPYFDDALDGYDVIVDCMLGTGFCGKPREKYRSAIEKINLSGAYVVSVDINSGMNGDTGIVEYAVHSDLTVTIGYVKQGLITPCAGSYIGKLVCVDIGIMLLSSEGHVVDGCETQVAPQERSFPRPDWLETDIIKAY